MSKTFLTLFSATYLALATVAMARESQVLAWTDPEALTRLVHSDAKAGFARLSNHFESQSNKFFCGPTSSTIVLNALRLSDPLISKPQDKSTFDPANSRFLPTGYNPVFERYTQNTFFNARTEVIKTKAEVCGAPLRRDGSQDFGLTLNELAQMLAAHDLAVQLRQANENISDSTMLEELKIALKSPETFVVANYHRSVLSQAGAGHISPVAAYDADSDSFLIMDVNPNIAPWVWVSSELFLKAMRTVAGTTRGYVIVREGPR